MQRICGTAKYLGLFVQVQVQIVGHRCCSKFADNPKHVLGWVPMEQTVATTELNTDSNADSQCQWCV